MIQEIFPHRFDNHFLNDEKTKEQATNDKQRERILLNHFSKVIRFTGSEIYTDTNKCVQEVLNIIQQDLRLEYKQ